MAAFDVLVVQHRVAKLAQPCRHLARVAGVDTVVAGAGAEQHRRHGAVGRDVLIGAVAGDPGPLRRVVGIAVFGHPGRAGQQPVVAPHVQQRHFADHRAEQLRSLYRHRRDQQAAVAATHAAELRRGGDAADHQVLCDGDEIVVAALLVRADGGLVPARAKLSTAAQVGHDQHAAALQPGRAPGGGIRGLQADLEATVAVEHGRARRAA